MFRFPVSQSRINDISFHKSGDRLITGDSDGCVKVTCIFFIILVGVKYD